MPDRDEPQETEAAPPAEGASAGNTLGGLLPRRRRRIILALFLLSLSVFLASATGEFRSIDDQNLYSTTHSLTSLHPNVDVCHGIPQSADFLYSRGPYGCLDFSQPQLLKSYRHGAGKKYVSKYGIGLPIIAAPLFGVGRAASSVLSDDAVGKCKGAIAFPCCRTQLTNADSFRANCQGDTHDMIVQTTTLWTNSFVMAITVAALIIVALQLGASLRGAALVGLAFGFGSYAFAYAKMFDTEPGTAMCLIVAVLFGIEGARTKKKGALLACGLAAGAAVLFRLTALIFLPVFGLWFLVGKGDRLKAVRDAAWFSAGAGAVLLAQLALNAWRYGNALTLGYNQSASNLRGLPGSGSITNGLWGLWLSPGKSLFLYAPFVLLSIAGLYWSVRKVPREMALLIALVIANTFVFARVRFWAGDWAWGPRYMIIVLPCLAAMCAPLVNMKGWRNALLALGGLGLLFPGALGVFVNFNTYYQRAHKTLGPTFLNAIYHRVGQQPIWHHVKILVQEWGNLGRPYGLLYLKSQPRVDVWWLDDRWWITAHPGRLTAAVLMVLVVVALAISGALVMRSALRSPVAVVTPDADAVETPASGDDDGQQRRLGRFFTSRRSSTI